MNETQDTRPIAGNPKLFIEDLGYDIREDSEQPGLWIWTTPSDGCDISYPTAEDALSAAWLDAVAQTLAISGIRAEAWAEMSFELQKAAVLHALAEDDVAEWVGLHYGRNFEREPLEKRSEWVERYAEAHGIQKATPAGEVSNSLDQGALADKAFAEYEFGDGVMVTDTSGWEYTTPGHERTRKVYVETEREDDGPAPRWALNFTVRFDPTTGALSEAYAMDEKGQIWGAMPSQGKASNSLEPKGKSATNKLFNFIVRLIEVECSEAISFECQAEDVDHAVEQAENAYPGCKVVTTLRDWKVGETTWWEDPDRGLSSGRYVVREIATESGTVDGDDAIIVIANDAGTTAEVFPRELRTIPTLAELAIEVSNTEASDGCEAGYTVVHAGNLQALLNEIHQVSTQPTERAVLFMEELLDSVETLTGVAEEHGPRTLADLMYLQAAILKDGFIDHYPGESRVLEIVQALPSGQAWMNYIKTEYLG